MIIEEAMRAVEKPPVVIAAVETNQPGDPLDVRIEPENAPGEVKLAASSVEPAHKQGSPTLSHAADPQASAMVPLTPAACADWPRRMDQFPVVIP